MIDDTAAELFISGDEKAFRSIYNSFVQALLAYATTICGSHEQAEDIVQDVFAVCWEKKKEIRADVLGHWLVKVTRNMAVKAFRRNVMMAQYITGSNNEPAEESAMEHFAGDQSRELRAMKIVDSLSPERKRIPTNVQTDFVALMSSQ